MIFRQMFDSVSSTYTYVMASRVGGEARIIDPVFKKTDQYLTLLEQLDLKLVKVIDTHVMHLMGGFEAYIDVTNPFSPTVTS